MYLPEDLEDTPFLKKMFPKLPQKSSGFWKNFFLNIFFIYINEKKVLQKSEKKVQTSFMDGPLLTNREKALDSEGV